MNNDETQPTGSEINVPDQGVIRSQSEDEISVALLEPIYAKAKWIKIYAIFLSIFAGVFIVVVLCNSLGTISAYVQGLPEILGIIVGTAIMVVITLICVRPMFKVCSAIKALRVDANEQTLETYFVRVNAVWRVFALYSIIFVIMILIAKLFG